MDGGAVGQGADNEHREQNAGDDEQQQERKRRAVNSVGPRALGPPRRRRCLARRRVVMLPVGRQPQPPTCVGCGAGVVDVDEVEGGQTVSVECIRVIMHRARVMLNKLRLRLVCCRQPHHHHHHHYYSFIRSFISHFPSGANQPMRVTVYTNHAGSARQ